MGSKRFKPPSNKAALDFKTANKLKRERLYVRQKQARESERRDFRLRRKREENKQPELREKRLAENVPSTIDRKRVWDEVTGDEEEIGLNVSVSVEELKRRRIERAEAAEQEAAEADDVNDDGENKDEDEDSMLGDSDDDASGSEEEEEKETSRQRQRAPSNAPSIASTNLDMTPDFLSQKFPTLFTDTPPPTPKILITTSINSTLHAQAQTLCTVFPNSVYVPRSASRFSYKYSVKEISKFATNRNYTAVVVLKEDQKQPTGLTIVHLPSGPTAHFSISNWVDGKKLPGHGRPSNHYPELILNRFSTPLGMVTARLFLTLFPPRPELQGRQVLTLHNQRDYIFLRFHRYVFRDRRESEKKVTDAEGKPMSNLDIRCGLQELGPRMCLKLRRLDGEDGVLWKWKAHDEKSRTRFSL